MSIIFGENKTIIYSSKTDETSRLKFVRVILDRRRVDKNVAVFVEIQKKVGYICSKCNLSFFFTR